MCYFVAMYSDLELNRCGIISGITCTTTLIRFGFRIMKSKSSLGTITKTRPCNIQRFFKLLKLKIFGRLKKKNLIFAQNIDCGYTLEPPRRGGSNEYPQSMF